LDESNNCEKPSKESKKDCTISVCRLIDYLKRKFYERKTKKENESPQDRAARRTARATGWIAAFTIVLAVSSGFQVWAFIQGQRAFLTLSNLYFDPAQVRVGEPIRAVLDIKNGGRSIGIITEINLTVRLVDKLPETAVYDTGGNQTIPPIEAGGRASIGVKTNKVLNENGRAGYASGAINYFLYGYISFVDDFSIRGPKTIGFCFQFAVSQVATHGQFIGCDEPQYTYYR